MPSRYTGVYAITDAHLLQGPALGQKVEAALQGGLGLLQYRNKSANWQERRAEATALLALCRRYETPLLINDDVDLCLEVGADGVHLGQSDTLLAQARTRLDSNAVFGVTCHSDLALALRAQDAGASYVAFGRFFPSATKPNAPQASTQILQRARQQLHIPIVAIGGINAENGATLLSAGADMLAVIHYLFAAPDVHKRVQELNSLFSSAPDGFV